MLESVDWTDLGSVVERRVGSSPTARTKATAGLLAAAFICVCGGMHEMRPYKKLTIECAIISLFLLRYAWYYTIGWRVKKQNFGSMYA